MVCGCGFGLWFLHRKIRLTQLWVELSWVVAIKSNLAAKDILASREKGSKLFHMLGGQQCQCQARAKKNSVELSWVVAIKFKFKK